MDSAGVEEVEVGATVALDAGAIGWLVVAITVVSVTVVLVVVVVVAASSARGVSCSAAMVVIDNKKWR
jgi:hypothetical protein